MLKRILILTIAVLTLGAVPAHAFRWGQAKPDPGSAWYTPTLPSAYQTITVTNVAHIPMRTLHRIERVIVAQSRQLRAYWQTPIVRFGPGGWPLKLTGRTDCVQSTSGRCMIHNAVGYHNGSGATFGEVSTTNLGPNPAWSVTFSHEIMEMLVDPHGNRWVKGYLAEVCDSVETIFYKLRGVWVADFITPGWFAYGATQPARPTVAQLLDAMGHVKTPGDDSLA